MNSLLFRVPVDIVRLLPALAVIATAPTAERTTPDQYREPFAESFPIRQEQHRQIKAYGIFLVPKPRKAKGPLLIAQHGGGGNPEAICDLDTRANYRSFGREAVKRGYIVWAPALAMRCAFCGDEPIPNASRELLDQKLRLAGTSIIGLELYKIIESTRTLIRARPEIDAARVGMTGLSWGGFFTLYATALSPFIKVAAPSGYFRDYEQLLSRAIADDARAADREVFGGLGHFQAVGLICPRPCLVQIGEQDGALNNMAGARGEAERAARPGSGAVDSLWVTYPEDCFGLAGGRSGFMPRRLGESRHKAAPTKCP